MDPALLDLIGKLAPSTIYCIAVYILWQRLVAVSDRYESLLRENIEALAKLAKELEEKDNGK
jgi:hypothetical protein